MPRALFNGVVVAQSDTFEEVEGNVYFPPGTIIEEYFTPSDTATYCPWKGTASYCDITVDGKTCKDGAWVYREPKDAAKNIAGYYAFWNGVEVIRDGV